MDVAAEQVSFEDNLSLLDNLLLYPQLPETLSLLSDSIVLLDTYKDIFIWVGNQRPFVENDYLYQYLYNQAVELVESRYPSPSIHLLSEYSSEAKIMSLYLIPSHHDDYLSAIPKHSLFKYLTKEQQRFEQSKHLRTEEMSFVQYISYVINSNNH